MGGYIAPAGLTKTHKNAELPLRGSLLDQLRLERRDCVIELAALAKAGDALCLEHHQGAAVAVLNGPIEELEFVHAGSVAQLERDPDGEALARLQLVLAEQLAGA